MGKISRHLLAHWPNKRVRPGEAVRLATLRSGKKPAPDKLSATVRWIPSKDGIRAEAEVIDANFSVDTDAPQTASSVSFYFAPSGFDDTRRYLTVAPSGAGDAPVIRNSNCGSIRAWWRRTDKGYRVTVSVPYSSIRMSGSKWALLPVNAAVSSKASDDVCVLAAGIAGETGQTSRRCVGLLSR